MTYEELLALARRVESQTISTVTGRTFSVRVYRDSLVFAPASSGFGQSDERKAAERFLARYNETGSLRPGDYSDVTRNASYLSACSGWLAVTEFMRPALMRSGAPRPARRTRINDRPWPRESPSRRDPPTRSIVRP
jgi:hypothetical protein